MRASTMLGFLAMLCSQALALELDGTYTVASAGTALYLEDVSGQIIFEEADPQAWFFIEAETDRYAIVNNVTNNYISCGSTEGAICKTSGVAQLFQIDNISDNVYTFLEPESQLLLHRTADNQLDLSPPTPTNDESFELTQL
ncbi:hypothetical protein BDV24DRAFT_129170 [Aspergillus arachidicola]|uniref:Ricin B lectin domain-containing protein n=1 Tax=Aspergillus arachidicola TaxID=656916 RepID=A0A2G7FG67_9EURO|nr:hypothetical protein BDV24DRAFT_129170 [Aspergillus arachidicola]PIG79616.1 hypothetical protein AARAC_001482 [Aspergillus arachidicola]